MLSTIAYVLWSHPNIEKWKGKIAMRGSEVFDRLALPYRIARISLEPRDEQIIMPIQGLPLSRVEDSWGAQRSMGRKHEGIDMFAKRGSPVFSATRGYVIRAGTNPLGGNVVFVIGGGGVRYYYAHLETIAQGIEYGTEVTTDTVLGYVGTSGNASGTPPHLHFGMYKNGAENPFSLFVPRQ